MRRGEVRWYTFAAPDKRRPVVLLTRDAMIGRLNDVTVAAITTTIRNLDSEVRLSPADGLPVDCDQVQTLPRHKLGDRLNTLGEARMIEIERALLYALGFRPHK